MRRYPYLAEVPPDAPLGKDSPLPPPPPVSWDGLGVLIPTHPEEPEDVGDAAPDEANAATPIECTTWHDVALSIAAELMGKIRSDIFAKLGYSTSAVCICSPQQNFTLTHT